MKRVQPATPEEKQQLADAGFCWYHQCYGYAAGIYHPRLRRGTGDTGRYLLFKDHDGWYVCYERNVSLGKWEVLRTKLINPGPYPCPAPAVAAMILGGFEIIDPWATPV